MYFITLKNKNLATTHSIKCSLRFRVVYIICIYTCTHLPNLTHTKEQLRLVLFTTVLQHTRLVYMRKEWCLYNKHKKVEIHLYSRLGLIQKTTESFISLVFLLPHKTFSYQKSPRERLRQYNVKDGGASEMAEQ